MFSECNICIRYIINFDILYNMKINSILNEYSYLNDQDIESFYPFIITMIHYLKLEKFVKNIKIFNCLDGCYSLYNSNDKILIFGNNIFTNKSYNNTFCKAAVYILHELIHVMQEKYISMFEKCDILELKILKLSFLNNNASYSAILPLHEYQAFLNSNYILLNYLINKDNSNDINNCKNIITNLLYNNYYDSNINYLSPLEQTIKKFNDNINYNAFFYNDEEITNRLLFGMPVDKTDFITGVKILRKELKRS